MSYLELKLTNHKPYKLQVNHNFFACRVVKLWNSLPTDTTVADTDTLLLKSPKNVVDLKSAVLVALLTFCLEARLQINRSYDSKIYETEKYTMHLYIYRSSRRLTTIRYIGLQNAAH